MSSLTAIVVDDEPLARARIKRLLTMQGVAVLAEGENGKQAIELVNDNKVDMVFIDINMPVKNGLEAAQEISELGDDAPAIVFCTAYDEYAIEAFKTKASAYLLKPIQDVDVSAAIRKALSISRLQKNRMIEQQVGVRTLAVHLDGALQNIPVNRFRYFESIDKNVFAALDSNEKILVDKTLKFLEAEYVDTFIRIHRSTLINRQQVERLVRDDAGHTSVVITGVDIELPVSRRHLSEVKKCFR